MTVVSATVDDAEALAALHRQCFGEAWDAQAFRALLSGAETFAFAAPSAPPWEAFILARAAAGEAEILTLGTVPSARRGGHARALTAAAAAEAARRGAGEIFLEVAADNAAAIALYLGLGFAEVGARPGYYVRGNGGTDALILRAALPVSSARSSAAT
jgi:ribosomal-protein-alanine N-acetyltransferase